MKKLSTLERSVILLTVLFFTMTAGYFLYQDTLRDMTRVIVEHPPLAEAAVQPQPESPAPGILEGERININTASVADLTRLPGIGEVKAQNIVDYRTANGPFIVPEDLIKVSGIGQVTLEGLLDYVTAAAVEPEGGDEHAEDSGGG